MKILTLEVGSIKWIPIEADPKTSTLRIVLDDESVLEVSEEMDRAGLHYLAVRTPTGILAIYPDGANKVLFKVVNA